MFQVSDLFLVLWLLGFALGMYVFAYPTWEDRAPIEVVKVKTVPVLIEGPREIRR